MREFIKGIQLIFFLFSVEHRKKNSYKGWKVYKNNLHGETVELNLLL